MQSTDKKTNKRYSNRMLRAGFQKKHKLDAQFIHGLQQYSFI